MSASRPVALTIAAVVAYAAGGHWAMSRWPASPWSLALFVGLPVTLGVAALWRAGRPGVAVTAGLGALAVGALAVARGGDTAQQIYVAQHAGVHAAMAALFGATLRGPGDALITRLARGVHRRLTPAMHAYTRRLTLAWAAYFASMAALSLLLHALAPFEAWSLFANVLTPLTLVAMFVGEHWLRYRWHPEFERVRPSVAWRAWRDRDQDHDHDHDRGAGDAPREP